MKFNTNNMSIKVKNSQLTNETVQAINNLIEIDINASVAFRLARIIKELSSIVDDKVKMEQKILDKWIYKDENGNHVQAKDENGNVIPDVVNLKDPESFTKEMNSLMETENEIPFDKINFDDLQLKTAKVKDLMKLDFLFI
jgi:hypothetical protein